MTREQTAMSDPAAWLSILNHAALTVFKGAVGLLFDSRALLADALYSASDAAAELAEKVQLPGLKKWRSSLQSNARKGTMEPLLAVFFSVFLLMGGLQLMIVSIKAFTHNDIDPPEFGAGVAIVISIALKEAVFQFRLRQSRKCGADYSHSHIEMHRQSLYSSIAALIGVFGAMTGEAWDVPMMLYLDPAAALFISVLVLWRAYRLVKESVYGSLVADIHEEDATSFIETVQRVHGVIAVDDLKAQEYGHYVTVVAKISVNPRITVMEANDIANRAKTLLLHRFSHVTDVRIQVAPYEAGYPYKTNNELSDNDTQNLLQ